MLDVSNFFIETIRQSLENGERLELTLHGNSMFPTIQEGEKVCICKKDEYDVDDIVAYYLCRGGGMVIIIHRLLWVRKTFVIAKGDNNKKADPYKIPVENILGGVENYK